MQIGYAVTSRPTADNPRGRSQPVCRRSPIGVDGQLIATYDAPSALTSTKDIRGDASMGLMRGGGGPVAININGSSHDPEALATLVQRRIDESMNWRTHDTASEYT